ncbi:MAG TPA: hypothetical protein VGC79_19120, partial [Polyangiaceae bacterium]
MASLELSTAEFEQFAWSTDPTKTKWPGLVAPLFKDDYQWHLFVLHEGKAASMPGLAGQNRPIHKVADGINRFESNPTEFAALSKLLSVLFLADERQIGSGTLLHEMTHTWANY